MAKKSFEESLQRLDDIVKSLENGNAHLDDSMKLYEEGVTLVRKLTEELEKAEAKIRILNLSEQETPDNDSESNS